MLPRTYSPASVRRYMKRIRNAQQNELDSFDEMFDPAITKLINHNANAASCSREVIMFPLLVAVSGCMGPHTEVQVNSEWSEKAILWILLAGRRGDKKTPALARVKSAVSTLEKDIQVLHRASNKSTVCQPRILVDQLNLKQVEKHVTKTASVCHNLIGMFDNFGTFLRQAEESLFLNPSLLLELYESRVGIPHDEDETSPTTLHGSFVGMVEAVDAAALLEMFDADGLSDRVLIACPKTWSNGHISVQADQEVLPSIHQLLSTVRNYHEIQKVSYVFREDGRAAFQSCIAELNAWQDDLVDSERKRGVLGKAPGQLVRLCGVLCGLKNGLDLAAGGLGPQFLPSCAISGDTVNCARQNDQKKGIIKAVIPRCIGQYPNSFGREASSATVSPRPTLDIGRYTSETILMYLIRQKLSLLPDDETFTDEGDWSQYRNNEPSMDLNTDSNHCESRTERVTMPQHQAITTTTVDMDQQTRFRRPRNVVPKAAMGTVPSSQTMMDDHLHDYPVGVTVHEVFKNISGPAGVDTDLANLLNSSTGCLEHPSKRRWSDAGASGKALRIKRSNASKSRLECVGENSQEWKMFRSYDSGTHASVMLAESVDNDDARRNVSGVTPLSDIDGDLSATREIICIAHPNLTPSPRIAMNMFTMSDKQLLIHCAEKIKKLLLLPGMISSAAGICQKRLFLPVPKEMRVQQPGTTHPVWAALAYLKRVVRMELGELVHPVYRMHYIHFRKIRLEYMTTRARDLMKVIELDEEQYERSYPKFDDSHRVSYILIQDPEAAIKHRLMSEGQPIHDTVFNC